MKIPGNAIVTHIVPRVSETDGCGHINNTTLPVWFEAGRRDVFRALSPSLAFADWRLALVSMQIDFHRQIHYDRDVRVATWVSRLGNKSFQLGEAALQNDVLCATGRCTYVYFDYSTQKSEVIPEEVRGRLALFLASEST